MKFARIDGAHVFNAGTWNGLTFTEADLDAIVSAFDKLSLSGRVPLKFGHNTEQPYTDGQPALGWVDRIYRKGTELLADFRDVPQVVFEAIKSGLYKFVSIELLRPQSAEGGDSFPFVLDAVALLGAEKPAVSNLRDLQALAMTRRNGVVSRGERVVFTLADPATVIQESKNAMDLQEAMARIAELEGTNKTLADEAAALKAKEKAAAVKLHREKLSEVFERGIRAEAITPAQRDRLQSMLGFTDDDKVLSVSVEDVEGLVKGGKAASEHNRRASFSRAPEGDEKMEKDDGTRSPDDVVSERIEQFCRDNKLDPYTVEDRRKARRAVFSQDPDLASRYMRMHDVG